MISRHSTVYGIVLGLGSIFGAFFLEGGSINALFLIPPLIIVFGGTFSAVIIGFGTDNFLKLYNFIKIAISPMHYDKRKIINTIVQFSYKARREGLLALEKDISKIEYFFFRKLMRNAVDGTEPDALQDLADIEMKTIQERHYSNIFIFIKMGGYAPTMGILGTVMG